VESVRLSRRVRSTYRSPAEREWIYPVSRGYRLRCCDCGLVHRIDFQVVADARGRLMTRFRVERDNRSTAASRRERGKKA
jgi:hypothetical protein